MYSWQYILLSPFFLAILFTLAIIFIAVQKLLISCNPICLFLGLFLVQLESSIEKSLPMSAYWNVFPVFL